MPLKLAKDPRFSWPVKVIRPDAEEWKPFEFTAHFLAFTSQNLDALPAHEVLTQRLRSRAERRSPRTRGSPYSVKPMRVSERSIPADAGQPSSR